MGYMYMASTGAYACRTIHQYDCNNAYVFLNGYIVTFKFMLPNEKRSTSTRCNSCRNQNDGFRLLTLANHKNRSAVLIVMRSFMKAFFVYNCCLIKRLWYNSRTCCTLFQ